MSGDVRCVELAWTAKVRASGAATTAALDFWLNISEPDIAVIASVGWLYQFGASARVVGGQLRVM